MHQKLVWLSVLSILLIIFGASGSAAASQRNFQYQSTIPHASGTAVAPEVTQPVLIPVTGNPRLGWGTLVFYGLIAFAALTLILALLHSANQSTALYGGQKAMPEEHHEDY
jgi:hypothetical protein